MSFEGFTFITTYSTTSANSYNYSIRKENAETNISSPLSTALPSLTTRRDGHDFSLHLQAVPNDGAIIAILSLSFLLFLCSCLVLLTARLASCGRYATFVFLRSLCLSDILMSIYGMSKMAMLLFLDRLNINFFLPESFFFTASFASTVSVLSLNMDCFMKLKKPFEYSQIDKDNVITVMLLMWNAAFIVGFLPLMGWNQDENTVFFFSFYPWHYLLFYGCLIFVCLVVCIVSMVSVKKFHTFSQLDSDCFSTTALEIRKYKHLHQTIIVESVMWLLCHLPFFLYITLTCPQCLLSDFTYRDTAIIYFIPLFVAKSLFSSALQATRTLQIHVIMRTIISDTSVMKHLSDFIRKKRGKSLKDGDAAIFYTNLLCEYQRRSSVGENQVMMGLNQRTLHHLVEEIDVAHFTHDSSVTDSHWSLTGITNFSYRPSLDFGQAPENKLQNTTAL